MWTLEVDDAVTGAPLDGLTLTVTPYMPDHAHGTTTPLITPLPDPGIYSVAPVYFRMVGFWQVKVVIQSPLAAADPADAGASADATSATAPATSDNAVFPICIPS